MTTERRQLQDVLQRVEREFAVLLKTNVSDHNPEVAKAMLVMSSELRIGRMTLGLYGEAEKKAERDTALLMNVSRDATDQHATTIDPMPETEPQESPDDVIRLVGIQ
jgi:hypothetical protein